MWTFFDFIDRHGKSEVREWYLAASERVQAAFDAKLDILNGFTPDQWRRPIVGKLDGYADVNELRFKEEGTAWRILLCFGPGQMEATFLFPSREVNDRFVPASAPGTAAERAVLVRGKEGRRHVVAHDYP